MKKQLSMIEKQRDAYGGELLKTRKGRSKPRPVDSKNGMHIVMRSSQAKGAYSFRRHSGKVQRIVEKFSQKYGIKVLSMANVGNHLHFHVKLKRRWTYFPFIRAISSAIVLAVTGASKSKKLKDLISGKFWDHRPYTRVIRGFKGFLNIRDYIEVNKWEGYGADRLKARMLVKQDQYLRSG